MYEVIVVPPLLYARTSQTAPVGCGTARPLALVEHAVGNALAVDVVVVSGEQLKQDAS